VIAGGLDADNKASGFNGNVLTVLHFFCVTLCAALFLCCALCCTLYCTVVLHRIADYMLTIPCTIPVLHADYSPILHADCVVDIYDSSTNTMSHPPSNQTQCGAHRYFLTSATVQDRFIFFGPGKYQSILCV
jgi:hypothetical protein